MAKFNNGGTASLHETRTVLLPVGQPYDDDGQEKQKHIQLEIQALPPNAFLVLQREVPVEDQKEGEAKDQELSLLQDIACIYKGLRPGQIEFDAVDPGGNNNKTDFYRAILDELMDLGFSFNQYRILVSEILDLSGMKAKDVEAAEENFTEDSVES